MTATHASTGPLRWLPHAENFASFTRQSKIDGILAAFAVSSVLRCGGSIEEEILHRIAACHETRGLFFQLLQNHGKLELFPKTWRTWDAFAAANMVEWLMYPTELGREPDHLEKM